MNIDETLAKIEALPMGRVIKAAQHDWETKVLPIRTDDLRALAEYVRKLEKRHQTVEDFRGRSF